MNSTIKNIDRLQLADTVIDLQPIYDLGRTLPYNNKSSVQYFSVDDPKIIREFVPQVKKVVKSLLHLLKKTENKYHPAFIELSLYDPKNRTGKVFYSLLISNVKATIDCYKIQMEENLGHNQERGAIIPHKKLHTSAFYFYQENEREKETSVLKFNELSDLPKCIYIGRFDTSKAKEENDKEELKKYIFKFFGGVRHNCFKTLNDVKGKYEFNSSFLIPIFRPAALFKGEQENIYNGGGIFIYGNLSPKSNENEFVLELQTNLTKSIFKASHTQIAFDEMDTYNTYFTAMIIHQLKTKLHNNIINTLSKLKENNKLEKNIEESVNFSMDYVENIIKKLSIFLENFQPEHRDVVEQSIRFTGFENLVKNIAKRIGMTTKIFTNDSENVSELILRRENFELIIDELFENAMKYYRGYEMSEQKREMIVHWNIIEQKKILQILFLSANTQMKQSDIESFGKKIIIGKESSGLGGFLMNYALEQNSALRFPDGRYIYPQQEQEGLLMEFNFKIK